MPKLNTDLIEYIKKEHNNDEKQMEIITSLSNRLIVEAPAGTGKTKTLISKIAYYIANGKIDSTKKILALTFSVNASYKIKKDIVEKLPDILPEEKMIVKDSLIVTNYHGLSRRLLNYYGKYIVNGQLIIKDLIPIDERNVINKISFTSDEILTLNNFNEKIKNPDIEYIKENIGLYNDLVIKKVVSNGYILYNSIITLAIGILEKYPALKKQYQSIFSFIIVDEYQDTNVLGFLLLESVIGYKTELLMLGDSLQRIYGFMGAMPNIIELTKQKYKMEKIILEKNYRFSHNQDLLYLDKNIRLNAETFSNPLITEISNPNIIVAKNQSDEVKWIIEKCIELNQRQEKVTILVRSLNNNENTLFLLNQFNTQNVNYFYALFSDDDLEYNNFHERAYEVFTKTINEKKVINKKILENFFTVISTKNTINTDVEKSLVKLLRKFIDSIYEIYFHYKMEDLIQFIQDVFLNKGLRQYMDRIEENIIIATIHAFKGLESENVIMCDMESFVFPSYRICQVCSESNNNNCSSPVCLTDDFNDELSVFYVGVTRTKKNLYLTHSNIQKTRFGDKTRNSNCFIKLKGIGTSNEISI